jgi:hypothetical protein
VSSITGNKIRVKFELDNTPLISLMDNDFIFIENSKYRITGRAITPFNLPKSGNNTYIFYDSFPQIIKGDANNG